MNQKRENEFIEKDHNGNIGTEGLATFFKTKDKGLFVLHFDYLSILNWI